MFNKILIANRGEIACRIIRTAKAMGISTVAVYSQADSDALFVHQADEAYLLGAAPSTASYLNIDKIIALAKQSNAQAIHPGYGFLSENAPFARRCLAEDLIFIGPPVSAIEAMASKSTAKTLMAAANVPLVPGFHGKEQSLAVLEQKAKEIGYPILIKAALGGGGKGMRIVTKAEDFAQALASCQREAKASFADDSVLLEKYLQNPRHVEMQIFADMYGNVVHLFERDCSIQRRHQKIIEEAPAPNLSTATRAAMGQTAIAAAKSIGYVGAGTVEFLLDRDQQFYFMEMNTRLQVEHPVTEMITGVDLVEWQLRVAAKEALPLTQQQIKQHGHAFEVRIYAEDPAHDFAPSVGLISYLREPTPSAQLRIDTGITQNSIITPFYDPMIAKLIVAGTNREQAIEHLSKALHDYHLVGVKNNIAYLQAIITQPDFIAAKLSTHFIEKHNLQPKDDAFEPIEVVLCVLYLMQHAIQPKVATDWPYFRLNLTLSQSFYFTYNDTLLQAIALSTCPTICISFAEKIYDCQHVRLANNTLCAQINDVHYTVDCVRAGQALYLFGARHRIYYLYDPGYDCEQQVQSAGHLTAPMPGSVIGVNVNLGDKIQAGDPLMILEAMKMEHTIKAPLNGTVTKIHFTPGTMVNEGDELMVIEPLNKE